MMVIFLILALFTAMVITAGTENNLSSSSFEDSLDEEKISEDSLDEEKISEDSLDEEKISEELSVSIDIDPDKLNLRSQGRWITCYIEVIISPQIPQSLEDYSENNWATDDIDISTVKLKYDSGEISAELHPTEIGDHDNDGVPDLMVKFDRSELISLIQESGNIGNIILTVEGTLTDDLTFDGIDTIGVIG